MNLNEMSLSVKRNMLIALMSKANSDIVYKTSVNWGSDYEFAFNNMRMLLADYVEMFGKGRFESLDYEQKQQTMNTFNQRFDMELCKFPEFSNILNESDPHKL